MCSCLRDPQVSTIQDFNSETIEYQEPGYSDVEINNCSAPHYTVLLQLGEEGIHMNSFTFKNFVSLKLIIEGEVKEDINIEIENFQGVFGNVLGKLEIKGVVRCFNDSVSRHQRKVLRIKIAKVDTVIISNFFIKDPDNTCDIQISTQHSSSFMVKESKFQKNISAEISSDNCIRNSETVECEEVFIEHEKIDFTIKIVMSVIGMFAFVSLSVIITRVPF